MRITVRNAGPDEATLHVLPTLWFRNTWSWGLPTTGPVPVLRRRPTRTSPRSSPSTPRPGGSPSPVAAPPTCCSATTRPTASGCGACPAGPPYPKDGIDDARRRTARRPVNPEQRGTKAALHYVLTVPAGGTAEVRVRLRGGAGRGRHQPRLRPDDDRAAGPRPTRSTRPAAAGDERRRGARGPPGPRRNAVEQAVLPLRRRAVARRRPGRAAGRRAAPHRPQRRLAAPQQRRRHLDAGHVGVPLVRGLGPGVPLRRRWPTSTRASPRTSSCSCCREWYMHPNGQLPAYEWAFGDVNPPVHAWAALQVFEIDGRHDFAFLERVLHKLLLNFTWWVNRKDAEGNNVFEGGFLGLDNIGPFDRSADAARRGPARAERRHGVDGHVLPEPAGDRAGARRARPAPTRTWRPSSSSTSPTSPRP